jgi:hypothetical protein
MVTFLANQNIDYAATSRRKAFLISTPRDMPFRTPAEPSGIHATTRPSPALSVPRASA